MHLNKMELSRKHTIYSGIRPNSATPLQLNTKLVIFQSNWDGEYHRLTSFLDQNGFIST